MMLQPESQLLVGKRWRELDVDSGPVCAPNDFVEIVGFLRLLQEELLCASDLMDMRRPAHRAAKLSTTSDVLRIYSLREPEHPPSAL
jgi:hypothetical protein